MARELDQGELIDRWTLVADELAFWVKITSVKVTGGHVLIAAEGGPGYRAGYSAAVLHQRTRRAAFAAA